MTAPIQSSQQYQGGDALSSANSSNRISNMINAVSGNSMFWPAMVAVVIGVLWIAKKK